MFRPILRLYVFRFYDSENCDIGVTAFNRTVIVNIDGIASRRR